jgi:DNA-binding NarL/FixJ family response regulator
VELDVLTLAARGLSNREIARDLSITLRAVLGHLRTIYPKLGVDSRGAATRYAVLHGLV